MYDTYLIDGTDIRVMGVRHVVDLSAGYVTPGMRGGNVTYAGRDGEVAVDRSYESGVLPLGLVLVGSSLTTFNDALRTLTRLVKPGAQVTLTRRRAYTTGNEEHTAAAEYMSGLDPQILGHRAGRLSVSFKILGGLWYGDVETIADGAVDVLGDTRTHRMEITLSGGTNPTLTSSVTGHSLTFTGSTVTHDVVIDVEAMTAVQNAVDVSSALEWSHVMPFRLLPGAQTITCSSGDASIDYEPAYL